jgi:hypothetical protein
MEDAVTSVCSRPCIALGEDLQYLKSFGIEHQPFFLSTNAELDKIVPDFVQPGHADFVQPQERFQIKLDGLIKEKGRRRVGMRCLDFCRGKKACGSSEGRCEIEQAKWRVAINVVVRFRWRRFLGSNHLCFSRCESPPRSWAMIRESLLHSIMSRGYMWGAVSGAAGRAAILLAPAPSCEFARFDGAGATTPQQKANSRTGCACAAGRVCFFAPPHLASGSGRIWKCTTLGEFSLPPSMWKGVRLPVFDHTPRPFQPALGSSMRPSRPLAQKPSG